MEGATTQTVPQILGLTREDLRIKKVRGPMTQQVRKAVLTQGGEKAWQELLASLSEPCRQQFSRSVGLFEWVEAEHSCELSLAYQARYGDAWAYDRGRIAAREQLTFINRWLLKAVSPVFVIQNSVRFFRFYYQGGLLVVDELEPHRAGVSLWADGFYPVWYERGLPGWIHEAMTLAGARDVEVSYISPSGEGLESLRHQYRIAWR